MKTDLQYYLKNNEIGLTALKTSIYAINFYRWKNKILNVFGKEIGDLREQGNDIMPKFSHDPYTLLCKNIELNYPSLWEEIKDNTLDEIFTLIDVNILNL